MPVPEGGVISTHVFKAPVFAPLVAADFKITVRENIPSEAYTSPLAATSRSAARPVANPGKGAPKTWVQLLPLSVERNTPLNVEVRFLREA